MSVPSNFSDSDSDRCLTALEIAYKFAEPAKFLIVDDEPHVCDLLVRCLTLIGCDADYVTRGTVALDELRSKRYSGVLLDIKMPDMNGHEVLAEMKKLGITVPVIIVTGFPSEAVSKATEAYGVLAVISKPFTIRTLAATLSRYCTIFNIRHQLPNF
jgi:DNA-binding response OmpR family regulator